MRRIAFRCAWYTLAVLTVKDAPIIAFAGIYDCWHNKELDEYVGTYSIITTQANEMMQYIHNTNFRMPVILHQVPSSFGSIRR